MSSNESLEETLRESIAPFFEKGLLVSVEQTLKSGKEATVYACRGGSRIGGRLVAVKVYRPLEHRQFRDDGLYRDGRVILSSRVRRAVANGSAFGKEAAFGMWHGMEAAFLRELHSAGLDVPRVIDTEGNAIVMEFLGDEHGPAPQLRSVRLTDTEARRTWDRVVWSIRRMLSINRIHGDLSPYNLLWHAAPGREASAWIIDVPQMIDPRENRMARMILERDLENVWRYLSKFVKTDDPSGSPRPGLPDPWKLAGALWNTWREGKL